jgi:hypothetical protein
MKAIERIVLACKRCGHEWVRRNLSTLTGHVQNAALPTGTSPAKMTNNSSVKAAIRFPSVAQGIEIIKGG